MGKREADMRHLILAGALAVTAMMFGDSVGAVRNASAAIVVGGTCTDKECNTATNVCYPFVAVPRHKCTRNAVLGWNGTKWVVVSYTCTGSICQ